MQTFDELRNQRVCILGNSGSGKTTLGKRMASEIASPLLELDSLVWAKEMPPRMRDDAEIQTDLERYLGANERWVIEGCYAKWAAACLAAKPLLLFLAMTEEQCVANCLSRPWQPEKFASKSAQDRTLPFLLDWVRAYYTRDDDMSRKQHAALFEAYDGPKLLLESREALNHFLGG